jgi:hypothetical protein
MKRVTIEDSQLENLLRQRAAQVDDGLICTSSVEQLFEARIAEVGNDGQSIDDYLPKNGS